MTAAQTVSPVPQAGKGRPPKLPVVAERTLANGLRVLAVRRPGVPRAEVRLLIPVGTGASADGAVERLTGETLLSGTAQRSAVELAEDVQRLGASLSASVGVDHMSIGGSTLAMTLVPYLELLAEVLCESEFPADEIALHRARVAQEIVIVRSQPANVAHEALVRRLFGQHVYARGLPDPDAVTGLERAAVRSFARKRIRPGGATLVAVGDFKPDRFLDLAERALAPWAGDATGKPLKAPAPIEPGPIVLVDRPGAVQTNIRVAGPALSRLDPAYPALAVANMVFGGYFSSRLVNNIREDKGYTYSPRSGFEHRQASSTFTITADVATEVTAPALHEINYELSRMATSPVPPDELLAAKRYLRGSLALSSQTQAGLAAYLVLLTSLGIGIEYLRDFPAAVDEVTAGDVAEASRRFLAPRRLVTVLVGDAARIAESLDPLGEVTPGG